MYFHYCVVHLYTYPSHIYRFCLFRIKLCNQSGQALFYVDFDVLCTHTHTHTHTHSLSLSLSLPLSLSLTYKQTKKETNNLTNKFTYLLYSYKCDYHRERHHRGTLFHIFLHKITPHTEFLTSFLVSDIKRLKN